VTGFVGDGLPVPPATASLTILKDFLAVSFAIWKVEIAGLCTLESTV
jgi:hypothetical protein